MEINAYAKINLLLDITGKREDGYHRITTVMQQLELCDVLNITVKESDELRIMLSGEGGSPDIKWDETNLAYRAAQLFAETYFITSEIRIHVTKKIPSGAGMGGGSADAAAVLCALNALFNTNADRRELADLATNLGADIPFCLYNGTALCTGIGEVIFPLKRLSPHPCLIVKPKQSISTKYLYEAVDAYLETKSHTEASDMVDAIKTDNIYRISSCLFNYFDEAAEAICPEISDIKKHLTESGALNSLMTGSGSAVFGLYADKESAERSAEQMKKLFPDAEVILTSFGA